jgi:2-keto-3-deoxygluconate permease
MLIPIKRTMERVPGGMMTILLGTGAVISTLAPHVGSYFGSFPGALFSGALPVLAVFYVCIGATISVRSLPAVVRKGGAIFCTKILLGIAVGVTAGHWLGIQPVASGWFSGFSTISPNSSNNSPHRKSNQCSLSPQPRAAL